MLRVIAILMLAIGLSSCGAIDSVKEGYAHARAVETEIERSVGIKPGVGFNWHNGRLVQVTVMFPEVHDRTPLRELGEIIRASVTKEFKQEPENIVFGFAIPKPRA